MTRKLTQEEINNILASASQTISSLENTLEESKELHQELDNHVSYMPQLEATSRRLEVINKQMKGKIVQGVMKSEPGVKEVIMDYSNKILRKNIQDKMKAQGIVLPGAAAASNR